jgi:Fe-S cluster assembly ATP-binding protein
MNSLLSLKQVEAFIEKKHILKKINLTIYPGEVHILFGPNGSGKSTLVNAIVGLKGLDVRGSIVFHGKELIGLDIHERIRLGLGVVFQNRPRLKGLTLAGLLDGLSLNPNILLQIFDNHSIKKFLHRDLDTLSGGEWRLIDLAITLSKQPNLIILDEIEAGVDVENIRTIARLLNSFLQREETKMKRKRSALIITHTGTILKWLDADFGHVMIDGKITPNANPYTILKRIEQSGYKQCYGCVSSMFEGKNGCVD